MKIVASQDDGGRINLPQVNQLVGALKLLEQLWPDEASRPSLRWLRHQQRVRSVPSIRAGRRVLFCPAHVLTVAGGRLTVLPSQNARPGPGTPPLPTPDIFTDAAGLTKYLSREFGLKRSLRWVRQQQRDRSLPFLRWGRRIFFSPAQIKAAMQNQASDAPSFH
jgi:hypothetical protein